MGKTIYITDDGSMPVPGQSPVYAGKQSLSRSTPGKLPVRAVQVTDGMWPSSVAELDIDFVLATAADPGRIYSIYSGSVPIPAGVQAGEYCMIVNGKFVHYPVGTPDGTNCPWTETTPLGTEIGFYSGSGNSFYLWGGPPIANLSALGSIPFGLPYTTLDITRHGYPIVATLCRQHSNWIRNGYDGVMDSTQPNSATDWSTQAFDDSVAVFDSWPHAGAHFPAQFLHLIWPANAIPAWLNGGNATPALMKARITYLMQRYANKLAQWNVTNELLHAQDTTLSDGPAGLRSNTSFWCAGAGNSMNYITNAWSCARALQPTCGGELLWNDNLFEDMTAHQAQRRAVLLAALKWYAAKGLLLIDGVGSQGHLNGGILYNATPDYLNTVREIKSITTAQGKPLKYYLTEVDNTSNPYPAAIANQLVAEATYRFLQPQMDLIDGLCMWGTVQPVSSATESRADGKKLPGTCFDASGNMLPLGFAVASCLAGF